MIPQQLLPVLAAIAGLASAQSTNPCDKDWDINSQADARALASCPSIRGNIVIGSVSDQEIDINGPTLLDGNFIAADNRRILSLKSSSLSRITGDFRLRNVTALASLTFPILSTVGSITFQSLPALDVLTFTTGVTSARNVTISDTFLRNFDGLNFLTVGTMFVDNNRRLTAWTSPMTNITTELRLNANGDNTLAVSLPNLSWAGALTISNVTSFEVPKLQVVNGSARFDSNFFKSFTAPNLTSTSTQDISFVSNGALTNISMPALTSVAGGFLVANNTALQKIDGFPALKTVGGAVKFRGVFKEISLPALTDVKGAFDASSSDDIATSCAKFAKQAPVAQGGNGQIQGKYDCVPLNAKSANDTGNGPAGTSGGTGGGGGNSAAGFSVNIASVLSLALVAAVYHAWL